VYPSNDITGSLNNFLDIGHLKESIEISELFNSIFLIT
jgi:hypothetical protein